MCVSLTLNVCATHAPGDGLALALTLNLTLTLTHAPDGGLALAAEHF